ncbi:uncharacterized protein N7515_005873 [Penicillium bovifimosum]|uniref:Uncharacterized protein n=1 Tax=Penicillium bovifimosum TaxID=126998 RepID=A0A9W9GV97_9EURO|nr:uncharacterized protein N7515_005873 [Penicillium bovifimosum]KAJ5129834.1 hypothetical protein N7515_005873 [Penicillium bovifimosum]
MQTFGPEYTQFAVAALTKGIAELSPDQVHRMLEWRYPGILYLWHASINQIVLSTAVRYLLYQNSPFSDYSDFVLPVPFTAEKPLSGIVPLQNLESAVSLAEEPEQSAPNPAVSLADEQPFNHTEPPPPPPTPPVQPSVVPAPAAPATPTTIVMIPDRDTRPWYLKGPCFRREERDRIP